MKMLEKDIGHNHWNENKLVKMKRYPEFKNADVHYVLFSTLDEPSIFTLNDTVLA